MFISGESLHCFLVGWCTNKSYVIATSDLRLFIHASNLLPSLPSPTPLHKKHEFLRYPGKIHRLRKRKERRKEKRRKKRKKKKEKKKRMCFASIHAAAVVGESFRYQPSRYQRVKAVPVTAGMGLDSSAQLKMVSMRSETHICAPPRLSEVSPTLFLKWFQRLKRR